MTTGNADDACTRTVLQREDAASATPRVLIAEDQPAIQELLRCVLQLAGYRTTVCAGRQAALTWIDQVMLSEDHPALILLDLSIPCTNDAADFLRHLRARWHDACGELPPIIVLTTSKQVQEDLTPGEWVILKPFHVRDLLVLIQRVIPFASRSEDCPSSKERSSDQRGRMLPSRSIAFDQSLLSPGLFLGCCIAMRKDDIPDSFAFKQKYYSEAEEWINIGDSAIVNPEGVFIAGPVRMKEEILYAELDPRQMSGPRWMLDVAGHYGRPDVFELTVHTEAHKMIKSE